jgi:hypothetical protein
VKVSGVIEQNNMNRKHYCFLLNSRFALPFLLVTVSVSEKEFYVSHHKARVTLRQRDSAFVGFYWIRISL